MFAITGAMGQTGSIISSTLLEAGQQVRMIVRRDDAQTARWRDLGADICVADAGDDDAMVQAFSGVHSAYLMGPPNYGSDDLYAQAQRIHATLIAAANQAGVRHVVALSSVGAQHEYGTGNILTTHDLERQLARFHGVRTVLRAANFMENWAWSLQPVLEQAVLPSMFLPLERRLPMVSVTDIGRTAAQLLLAPPASNRLIELHGPRDVSPLDVAQALSELLGRVISAQAVPRERWAEIYTSKGMPPLTVAAFCDMFDGFNSGHIVFENSGTTMRGTIGIEQALAACLHAGDRA